MSQNEKREALVDLGCTLSRSEGGMYVVAHEQDGWAVYASESISVAVDDAYALHIVRASAAQRSKEGE